MGGITIAVGSRELRLSQLEAPLVLDDLAEGTGSWEVEIGFGKGRYLLARAGAEPETRFLGIEVAGEYYRRVRTRMMKRGLGNLLLIRGEALYLLAAILPSEFASAVHVYFPDPWPKARHHGRRLLDAETADLVLGLLAPDGVVYFATDFSDYGTAVEEIFESLPGASVHAVEGPWEGEPRTNYEAKYLREGRPIRRLVISRRAGARAGEVHPLARRGVRVAIRESQTRGLPDGAVFEREPSAE